jgi:hypothetical protein
MGIGNSVTTQQRAEAISIQLMGKQRDDAQIIAQSMESWWQITM